MTTTETVEDSGQTDARPAAESDLRARVDALRWHHQIDFGNGILSPGSVSLDVLRAQAEIYFQFGIRGQSFLDIGCWDGFNSIEAHRRGASRVLATDHYVWSEESWGRR